MHSKTSSKYIFLLSNFFKTSEIPVFYANINSTKRKNKFYNPNTIHTALPTGWCLIKIHSATYDSQFQFFFAKITQILSECGFFLKYRLILYKK